MGPLDGQNPLNPPVDRHDPSQTGWTSDWPPKGEGSGSKRQKCKRKRKRRSGSDSPESQRPPGVAGSHSSKHAQTNRFLYCLPVTEPKLKRARKGSTAWPLQQFTGPPVSSGSSAGAFPKDAAPPVNYASSVGSIQCWKPEHPLENKSWRAILMGETAALPKGIPIQEPLFTNQGNPAPQVPEACLSQALNSPGRLQPNGRLGVPQFRPPYSAEVPYSEIRFDIEYARDRGVPFADLLAGLPGLVDARRQVFAAGINPGGVVIWITVRDCFSSGGLVGEAQLDMCGPSIAQWPGYPAWKDRLATTDGGRPITLAELGCKIAKAYGRFFVVSP